MYSFIIMLLPGQRIKVRGHRFQRYEPLDIKKFFFPNSIAHCVCGGGGGWEGGCLLLEIITMHSCVHQFCNDPPRSITQSFTTAYPTHEICGMKYPELIREKNNFER